MADTGLQLGVRCIRGKQQNFEYRIVVYFDLLSEAFLYRVDPSVCSG